MENSDVYASELQSVLTYDCFCRAFESFIKQADENAISGKGRGSKKPEGISYFLKDRSGKLLVDGGALGQQFGQGAASKSPYFNWHVLSIYYIPSEKRIVLGIEANRYHSLEKLRPYTLRELPGKNVKIAVFYECRKPDTDYQTLYQKFIALSEEIMRIGL